MTVVVNTGTLVFFNYHEIWGYCNEVKTDINCDAKEVNVFNGGWKENIGGLKSGSMSLKGFQDYTAGEDAFVGSLSYTSAIISVAPAFQATVPRSGVGVGAPVFFTKGNILKRVPVSGTVGEVSPFDLMIDSGFMPAVDGVSLTVSSIVRTASGGVSGLQIGAVPDGKKMWAVLHVPFQSGTFTADIKVQSDDNASFTSATDRITFATTGSGGAWEQTGSVAGPITDDYWRAVWTIAGTSPQIRFLVAAGIA